MKLSSLLIVLAAALLAIAGCSPSETTDTSNKSVTPANSTPPATDTPAPAGNLGTPATAP